MCNWHSFNARMTYKEASIHDRVSFWTKQTGVVFGSSPFCLGMGEYPCAHHTGLF